MDNLNDLDIASPLVGSTIDELAAEVRNLKTILKNVLLVAHLPNGNIVGSAVRELAAETVDTEELVDGAVTATKLASDAVTTAKILNANVTGAKIAAGALNAGHFSPACIPPTAFQTPGIPLNALMGQITTAMIADASVTNAKLANLAVTDAKIASMAFSKLAGSAEDNQVLTYTTALGWHAATPAVLPAIGVAVLGELAPGSGGDITTAKLWNVRLLSITQNEIIPIVTTDLNGLNFTVGKFFLFLRCPAKKAGSHMIRLVRKTLADNTTSVAALGSTGFNSSTNDVQTDSLLFYAFAETVANTYSYYVEHYIEVATGTDDFGVDADIVVDTVATNNQHTSGFIFKLP